MTTTQVDTINNVNLRIQAMSRYGYRQFQPKHSGWLIMWSNASQSWHIGQRLSKQKIYRLDSNVAVVYGRKTDVLAILPYLKPLTLFTNSFEAKHKA